MILISSFIGQYLCWGVKHARCVKITEKVSFKLRIKYETIFDWFSCQKFPFPKNFSYFSGFCQFPYYSENPKRFEHEKRGCHKKIPEGRMPISAWISVLSSSHISIPDTGDNGPIWRWFFTLSNLFRLVVVVSLERLFILNFLGMQYTLGKLSKNGPKKSWVRAERSEARIKKPCILDIEL